MGAVQDLAAIEADLLAEARRLQQVAGTPNGTGAGRASGLYKAAHRIGERRRAIIRGGGS